MKRITGYINVLKLQSCNMVRLRTACEVFDREYGEQVVLNGAAVSLLSKSPGWWR